MRFVLILQPLKIIWFLITCSASPGNITDKPENMPKPNKFESKKGYYSKIYPLHPPPRLHLRTGIFAENYKLDEVTLKSFPAFLLYT